jgi:hypothetical protein
MSLRLICERIFWNFSIIASISDNHQNLRVEDARLLFDDRWLLFLRRGFTSDNRFKVIECINRTIEEWNEVVECYITQKDGNSNNAITFQLQNYIELRESVKQGLTKLSKLDRYVYDMTFQMYINRLIQRLGQIDSLLPNSNHNTSSFGNE